MQWELLVQAEQLHPRHDRGGDDGDALQGLRPPHPQLQRLRRPRHLPRHGRRPTIVEETEPFSLKLRRKSIIN